MFDRLTDRLQTTLRSWQKQAQGKSTLTADNMAEALRDVRRALLEADVNLQVVKRFMDRLQDDAVGQSVLNSVEPGEQLIKLVHDELVTLLGGHTTPFELAGTTTNPDVILMSAPPITARDWRERWARFPSIKAVANRQVLTFSDVRLTRMGPSAIDSVAGLCEQLDRVRR